MVLTWTAPFDGNDPIQTYKIQYRIVTGGNLSFSVYFLFVCQVIIEIFIIGGFSSKKKGQL